MAITKGLNSINRVEETRNYFLVRLISSVYTVLLVAGVILLITLGAFGKRILFVLMNKKWYNYIKETFVSIYNLMLATMRNLIFE